ncbi:polyketide synthase dehydratase domain-containing protein, partial [Streptomyces sp. NPDC056099]|uniref:polyketide synthase dehydratase domain-containing protein n=1 Tax=Streptomyces sp. NPDC056099 TaxID=3345711 RepID=UPI0035E17721
RRADLAFYSTVTGEVSDGTDLDGGYWCRNLREPVRFDRALNRLLDDGHTVFVEISAHPVLSMPLTDGSADRGGIVVGTLARDHGTTAQLLRNLGLLHVQGHTIDWEHCTDGRLADLPTYAFQHEHYWMDAPKPSGDVRSVGLDASGHPWLGAALALADGEGHLLTGRLSLTDQPWLAEHAAFGTVLVPGTGLLELALTAAHHIGATAVEELTLLEPLVLTDDTPLRLQVVVGAETPQGRRPIHLFSRPENISDGVSADAPWRRHASGELSTGTSVPEAADELAQWPVPGAEQVALDGFYEDFRARGLEYGPAFQGLTGLWRKGNTAYGTVRLPDGLRTDDFGIHPALLDAALHAMVAVQDGTGTEGHVPLPFEWTGVELYATGATELRIRIELDDTGTGLRLWATDPTGQPLLHARGLQLRPADSEQLRAASTPAVDEHLYRVEFQAPRVREEAPAQETWVLGGNGEVARALDAQGIAQADGLFARLDEGIEPPGRVVVDATGEATGNAMGDATDGVIDDALEATADALVTVQRLLAEPRLEKTEFIWVTRGAVDAGDGIGNLVRAPLWGLLRAVRAEHPERVIRLVDLDAVADVEVPFLVDEPEVVVRE